eukprot:644605-Pelagomonas_calceolata.AAC.2
MLNKRVFRADACPLGLQGVGLQPENLADARPLEALSCGRVCTSQLTRVLHHVRLLCGFAGPGLSGVCLWRERCGFVPMS